jgi:tRNA pseudouridine38-40 synthase
VRTVMKAEWMPAKQDEWHFEVQADAFLYRMVRRLVFVQVAVAQGKLSAEVIAHSFELQAEADPERSRRTRSEIPAGLAPAHGLTLVEVMYRPAESMGQ